MLHKQMYMCMSVYYYYADLAYLSYKAVWQSGGLWESCRVTARFQGNCAICLPGDGKRSPSFSPSLHLSLWLPVFVCFKWRSTHDLAHRWNKRLSVSNCLCLKIFLLFACVSWCFLSFLDTIGLEFGFDFGYFLCVFFIFIFLPLLFIWALAKLV